MAEQKTNAMRILERAGVPYRVHTYDAGDGKIDGESVAKKLGADPRSMFKTLVTRGADGAFCVFVVPVCNELDLKKCARAVGEKSVEMLAVTDINKVTGYIRGGCSPVGMKKQYRTVFDESALGCGAIIVSAGKIGWQIEAEPQALATLTGGTFAGISKE